MTLLLRYLKQISGFPTNKCILSHLNKVGLKSLSHSIASQTWSNSLLHSKLIRILILDEQKCVKLKAFDQFVLIQLNLGLFKYDCTFYIYNYLLMSFYKILVQPAKSSKGKCNTCKQNIEQNQLRIQVSDDRQFKDYISKNGGISAFSGQGMSRGGYIQTENGTISIKKYFVHLQCYQPISLHPFEHDYFSKSGFGSKHKEIFQHWLSQKRKTPFRLSKPIKSKKNRSRKDSDQESFEIKKTKKINKRQKDE